MRKNAELLAFILSELEGEGARVTWFADGHSGRIDCDGEAVLLLNTPGEGWHVT